MIAIFIPVILYWLVGVLVFVDENRKTQNLLVSHLPLIFLMAIVWPFWYVALFGAWCSNLDLSKRVLLRRKVSR